MQVRLIERLGALNVWSVQLSRAVLAGFAQVFMYKSPLAGACLVAAIALGSPMQALNALAGALVGALGAKAINLPAQSIRQGVCCFNGALIGIVLTHYLGANPATFFLTVVCSASSLVLGSLVSKLLRRPHYSSPFVLLTWLALATTPTLSPPLDIDVNQALDPALAVLQGIGQGIFQSGTLSSALVLVALAIAKPAAAAVAVGVSAGAVVGGLLLGAPVTLINAGLLGYNPVLAVLAMRVAGRAVPAQILAALLAFGIHILFWGGEWPALHAPFIGAVWLMQFRGVGSFAIRDRASSTQTTA